MIGTRTLLVATCLVCAARAGAQPNAYDHLWKAASGDGRFGTHGRDLALSVNRGMLVAPDIVFRDATIEFDVHAGPDAFAGLAFRMQGNADYDIVYLATDSTGRWREAQYQGVYQGETSWQLYPGAGYRGAIAASATHHGWIHVRLVVNGTRARLWAGDGAAPVLDVPVLQRDARAGYVGLWSQGGNAGRATDAEIAALRIDSTHVPSLDDGARVAAEPGALVDWQITARLSVADTTAALAELPTDVLADPARWHAVRAEASGLVNLTREAGNSSGPQAYNVFGGAGWGMALARTTFTVTNAETRRLELGYSDRVSVFLDGRLVYHGDNSYGAPGGHLGRVRYDNATLDLSLAPGAHVLVLAVSDHQFGWGFEARWARPARADPGRTRS